MKKTKRSAFTIVELVIVIAVIAVLSAVLIPTFGSIIESANKAVDTQLVAQINTVLAIEDVLGGGVNDAVEIQKIVKESGLKLQTKSKGQYIWYDIENKKAVLGGLDENGLVLETNARAAAAPFNPDTTAPENFIAGYLFLSTESADDLAENIYALRNPEGSTPDEVKASLNETLGKIENTALKNNLTAMLSTTAVMTKDGVTGFIGSNNSSVTRVIVSSEMTNISTSTISTVLAYPNVVAVDFHSGVVSVSSSADDDAVTVLKNRTEIPYFVYSNDELKKVDTDNGNIAFLIHKDERGNHIKKVHVVNVINNEEKTISEFTEYSFTYNLGYEYLKGTASESYDFVGYSFYEDGANPLALGEHTHELNSTEKLLIDGEGNLTIYLVYERVATDFMVGNEYYSSKTTTRKLAKGEITSGTITVVSKTATLGSATETSLTIPSGVELLLPYKADFTKGSGTSVITKSDSFNEINFATGLGATQLTIPADVTLVNQGAIHVDACLYYNGTSVQSFVMEKQSGVLVVDGAITSTGKINALGAIRGSGTILASGGEVIEVMTIYDWYGGTNAAMAVGITEGAGQLAGMLIDVDGKATSPFNDWKVQNIQVPVTIQSNTKYEAQTVVNIDNSAVPLSFTLAGPSDALFVMEQGAEIERATNGENVKLTITKGSVHDTKKTLPLENVVVSGTKATVDFSIIDLPLSHFDVNIAPYADLTISYNNYKVMPGSSITVEENATLNINTKVVICNSFDLRFNSKSAVDFNESINLTKRVYCTFVPTVDANGVSAKVMQATLNSQNYEMTGWTGIAPDFGWVTKSSKVLNLTIPTTVLESYSERDPAELIVKGTLKFDNDTDASTKAYFAGEITSTREGAIIEVSSAVEACSFNHGYGIKLGDFTVLGKKLSVSEWYTLNVNGLHNATVLAGVNNKAGTLAAGTYKYVSVSTSQGTQNKWTPQTSDSGNN